MNKVSVLASLLLFTLFLSSCTQDAILTLYNNTNSTTNVRVDDVNYHIPAYHKLQQNWSLSTNVFSVEEQRVSVRIQEKLFLFPLEFIVMLKGGNTVYREINYNAAGLEIVNDGYDFITAVYISPTTTTFWGNNRLTGSIAPGNYVQWNLTEGFWDVKVTTYWGSEHTFYNMHFSIGSLRSVYIPYSMSPQENEDHKIDGDFSKSNSELRINQLD